MSAPTSLSYEPADTTEPVLDITVGDALRSAAAQWPYRPAMIEGSANPETRRRWTFAEALADAERVARALLARFEPGESVAIWAGNQPEWFLVEFGAALAGLTLVTINPAYLAGELAFVLNQSKASGILVQDVFRDRELTPIVESVRSARLRHILPLSGWTEFLNSVDASLRLPDVSPLAVAQVQYTSGTTGAPKGARLFHRGIVNNGRFYAKTIGAGEADVWVNPMPMFHTAGCGLCTLGALQTGGAQVMPPAFDPERMLELIEQERGTITISVPTMLQRMLDSPAARTRDISSWRLVTLGGTPVPPELIRRAAERGIAAGIGFGQTEASPYLTHTLPNDPHPEWMTTVGRVLPQTELKIVDSATGDILPRGKIGEICARGYSLMKDYFDNPLATAAAIDNEGWLHTGDLGSLDEHGYCRVQGRLKDMIIRGGENIYAREIEDVLFTHPAVVGASVIGVPDPDYGEIPVGFVIGRPGAELTGEQLEAFCREQLASYKAPRVWRFVEQFPQTASGKTQKYVLRDNYLKEAGQA